MIAQENRVEMRKDYENDRKHTQRGIKEWSRVEMGIMIRKGISKQLKTTNKFK